MVLSILASVAMLTSYKDDLFASPRVIEQRGDFSRVEYIEMRDINGRDEIPVKKVRAEYTSPLKKGTQRVVDGDALEAGDASKAKFAVIFVHGGGGNANLGFDDFTFGGNFNRLKHLSVESGGLYVSPSFHSFSDLTPIEKVLERIPSTSPIVIACGSAGGEICWKAYRDERIVSRLAGLILMGAQTHKFSDKEAGVKQKVPVYLAHGSRDPVFHWTAIQEQYDWLQKAQVPSKFVMYESGNHGTPIRMIDYREAINWMFGATP